MRMTLGLSTPRPAHHRRTTSRASRGGSRPHQRAIAPTRRSVPPRAAAALPARTFAVVIIPMVFDDLDRLAGLCKRLGQRPSANEPAQTHGPLVKDF